MKKFLSFILSLMPVLCAAQETDSLFVREDADGRWMARYNVQGERSVFEVAKKFGLPAATIADLNHLSYADKLLAGAEVKIPLTVVNWYNYNPPAASVVAPLYYRIVEGREKKDFARRLGVSDRQFAEWNPGTGNRLEAGRVVAAGWINVGGASKIVVEQNGQTIMPAQLITSSPIQSPDTVVMIDTAKLAPALAPMEQAFFDQTAAGTMVTTEKGPAAFFPAGGGTVKGVHYAFHNTAPRGSVVRVYNIGTGRTVYVKVLGPLPHTKQYAGAIIGVSAAAKAELGVRGDARAYCEVSYAGY